MFVEKVDPDFFDLIIIDEAHHAEAKTWQEAIDYFSSAKVVKVTVLLSELMVSLSKVKTSTNIN
ncbi:DEAD/DEAH box helicase family protein [Paenibacillus silviterrae]|uniref:DEAD/DEAH box helicase family protein n=1 Tax=Paenibacillus silviterrae TaxID=3242194 RepID=UPI00350E49A1